MNKIYTTPSHSRALDTQFLTHMVNSVLEQETGKQLYYGQLRKHPRLQETWKNHSRMKWEDCAKELENALMVRVREFKGQTHSLQ